MLESFVRGLKMIGASIKLGWQDKLLIVPSILTVFTNIFFGCAIARVLMEKFGSVCTHEPGQASRPNAYLSGLLGLNGPFDPSGFGGALLGGDGALLDSHLWLTVGCLSAIWWLSNRFLEGVTTALVYNHLSNSTAGSFSQACQAVVTSLPAIIVLGLATFFAKGVARFLRNKRGSAVMGLGFGFMATIVEIFWTLAGHLILPAIVIEGTSFWGGLKRADRIAQSNLLTIGVGEVGVDGICRVTSFLVYAAGVGLFSYVYYLHISLVQPAVLLGALIWVASVVVVTALSIYVRAAFYTCLYVWAIDTEAVRESERRSVMPPAPLARALV